jgi:hypothetical protein
MSWLSGRPLLVPANVEPEHVLRNLDDRLIPRDRADVRENLRVGDFPSLSDEGTPVSTVRGEQGRRVADVGLGS